MEVLNASERRKTKCQNDQVNERHYQILARHSNPAKASRLHLRDWRD
jgi:hypothetical protein